MMRSNQSILLTIATAFFAAGLWSGCTVGFDTDQSGVFPCETNDDCLEGYECAGSGSEMFCEEITVTNNDPPPVCDQTGDPPGDIDLDDDGYGTGENRRGCPNNQTARDCNDDDAEINPGASELCNGVDDNCDGTSDVEEFSCETVNDCGTVPDAYNDYLQNWDCVNNSCVMKNLKHNIELPGGGTCGEISVTCSPDGGGFTYTWDGDTYTADEGPLYDECR